MHKLHWGPYISDALLEANVMLEADVNNKVFFSIKAFRFSSLPIIMDNSFYGQFCLGTKV